MGDRPESARGHLDVRVIRLLLADRHRSFVEALAVPLGAEPDLEVVAVVVQPEEALRAIRFQPVDVAVLSVDGGGGGFLDIGAALLATRPELKLVGVADGDDDAVLVRAVRYGFRGWVLKDVGIGALLDAVHAVCRGETCIPPLSMTRLLHRLLEGEVDQHAAELPFASLTAREQQVLRAMSTGAGGQEIAMQLGISPNTVRTHVQSILTKLGVHTSLAAVTLARRAGIY
jgi:DNA-binding NarL/FixJ family response regulator